MEFFLVDYEDVSSLKHLILPVHTGYESKACEAG